MIYDQFNLKPIRLLTDYSSLFNKLEGLSSSIDRFISQVKNPEYGEWVRKYLSKCRPITIQRTTLVCRKLNH